MSSLGFTDIVFQFVMCLGVSVSSSPVPLVYQMFRH